MIRSTPLLNDYNKEKTIVRKTFKQKIKYLLQNVTEIIKNNNAFLPY